METLYARVAEAVAEGQSVALTTLVRVEGSTPREVGSKMLVYADGRTAGTIGGGAMEAAVIDAASLALAQGEPRLLRYELRDPEEGDLAICGGEAEVFIDVIAPRPTLLVVGAGHVAMPVAEMGHLCGFRVVVLDDRPDMVSEARFPHASERISGEIVDRLHELNLTSQWHVVIVTRGHAYDLEALRAVVGSEAAYVGMIGSRRKVRTTFERLLADGVPEALLERVHSPIGLNIGAQTPAEIAVSILAEIIWLRKGARASLPGGQPAGGAPAGGAPGSMRISPSPACPETGDL
jgi:xanthine dehydrogenase accessory factor